MSRKPFFKKKKPNKLLNVWPVERTLGNMFSPLFSYSSIKIKAWLSGTRQECSHRSSLQLDSRRCSLWFNVIFEMNTIYDTAKHNQVLSFFKWLTLMWIKALFYMNVGEGPRDVCGWRKCCTTCSSLEFEHWWCVNPPVFLLFLFFSSWTVIYVQWMRLVGLFSSSCTGIIFSFFLVFFFCLYWSDCVYGLVKHQYLKVWNCWTSGCVDVRQLFLFFFL